MKKYRIRVKKRSILYLCAFTILNISLIFLCIDKVPNIEVDSGIGYFSVGLCIALDILLLFFSIRDRIAMSSDEKLKKLYIKENDERRKYIRQSVGIATILIIYFILIFATVVSGFYNKTVFLTLIAVDIVIGLIIIALKCYYIRRY